MVEEGIIHSIKMKNLLRKGSEYVVIIEESFFNLFVEMCKQILIQKYSEIRNPYSGEPLGE
jgi:hypothetical protein